MKALNPLVKVVLALCMFWFTFENLRAGDLHITQRIVSGQNSCVYPNIIGSTTSACSTTTVSMVTPSSGYQDYNLQDILTLGIDHNNLTYLPDSFTCTVTLQIQGFDKDGVALSPGIPNQTLTVRYTPFTYTTYLDKAAFVFKRAYSYTVTITNVSITGATAPFPANTLPVNVYLDADIRVQRYIDFTSVANTGMSTSSIHDSTLDIDCDSRPDGLKISWPTQTGAEEYDLEWTFVNDYANTAALGSYSDPANLQYNFRYNSTRITTTRTNYKITLAYEHGYVIYRVRGIGRDIHNPTINLYQAWSLPDSNAVSDASPDYYQVTTQHEYDSINYQYNATYAEEGKKKEVVTYYDGSLRSREAVTKMNSDSNVLVGQTIYDFQGRPAVTVLPTPVKFPVCGVHHEPSIHYFPQYNQVDSAGQMLQYSRYQFDLDTKDSCTAGADSMSVLSGSSNYYSPQNPRQYGFYAYIPDAHGFPFSQVQYTPDNTGRIKAQGGVGPQFQLGSTHETQYIYGQPNQLEMDRMFGEETGDATHYKKNVVIDPNGQASISYLDQEGRTVATCLAGDPRNDSTGHPSLSPLPSQAGAEANLQVDLFAKDAAGNSNNNTVSIDGNAIVFNSQLSVAYQSNYFFHYYLQVNPLEIPCSAPLCMNCVYNLKIQVLDDCGRPVSTISSASEHNPVCKVVGHLDPSGAFTTDCSLSSYVDTDGFAVNLMPGNYTVSKTLTVDSSALNYYIQQYENPTNNTCVKSLGTFQQQYLTTAYADTCNCHITCASCIASLGNRDDFVAMGKGTAEEYDFLYDQCTQPCKPNTLCDMEYQQMLADVSPSGQYGQYLTSTGTVNPGTFPVSVYNTGNALPANITSGDHGNWRFPVVTLNGHTYNNYVDDKGNVSIITVTPTGSGYAPAVSPTYVYLNSTTGQYYTYAQYLTNVSDFIQYWQASWAQSLVQYHPEYTYYRECSKYEVVQNNDTMTSETFDERLNAAKTFQQAVKAGFIVVPSSGIYAGDSVITNLFSDSAYHGKMYDPFITDATYETDDGGSSALYNAFTNVYNNYQKIGSTYYSMMQIAAMTARCGTNYSNTTTVSGLCTDFGTNFYASGFAKQNQAIKDSEWNDFKIFYLAQKQKYQYQVETYQALHNGGYNVCIGDTNYSAVGMFSGPFPYPAFSLTQPCSFGLSQYYISKQKRFVQQNDVPNQGSGNAGYQYFQQTGQCPVAGELQALLSALVQTDSIAAANVTLFNYPQFTPDLYSAITASPLPASGVTYEWNYSSSASTTDILTANIVDAGHHSYGTFTLNKTGKNITNWNQIQSLQSLQYTGTTGGIDQFTVMAVLFDPTNTTGHPYSYKQLTGTTTIQIHGCQFQAECNPNNFAIGIKNLMTVLAQYSALTGTNVDLETPAFKSLLTPAILNTFGTPNQNLQWTYRNGNEFDLFDNTDTSYRVRIILTSSSPNSFSINATNLGNVKELNNINSEGANLFSIDALDANENYLATFSGGVVVQNDVYSGSSRPDYIQLPGGTLSMGNCGLPASAQCSGQPYQNLAQLDSVVSTIFGKSINFKTDVNIVTNPYFTPGLASYLPSYLDSTSSREITDHVTTHGSYYYDTLKFTFWVSTRTAGGVGPATAAVAAAPLPSRAAPDSTSCPFYLTHRDSARTYVPSFSYLVSISHFRDTGEMVNGSYEDFYFIGGYRFVFEGDHDTIIYDTVFGHSCIPLMNCNSCNNNPPQTPVTYVPPAVSPAEPARGFRAEEIALPPVGDPIGDYSIGADSTGIWIPFKATSAYMLLKIHPSIVPADTPFVPIEDIQLYDSTFRLVQVSDTMNIGSDTLPVIQALRVDSGTTYYVRAQKYSAGICPACYTHSGYFAFSSANVGFRDPAVPNCNFSAFGPNLLYDGDFETPPPFASNVNCYQVRSYAFPDSTVPAYEKGYPTVSRTRFEACGFSGDGSGTDYTDIYRVTTDMGSQFQNDAHSGTRFLGVDAPSSSCAYCSTTDSTSTTLFYTPAYTSIAWAQRVTTTPGTTYKFSFWVQTMDIGQAPGAVVSAYINGVQYYTDVISDSNGYADWKQISLCWQSNSDSAVIFIQGKGDANPYGYDYALDDISFQAALNPPCNPPMAVDTTISVPYTPRGGDACVNQYLQNATANALNAYNNYIDSITTVVRGNYMQHCLAAVESLRVDYQDKQYHYTLYNYDQAGNLIRTVPPQGVQLFGITKTTDPLEQQIIADRTAGQHNVFNNNVLASTYVYNSLNQLTEQSVPDDDNMQIWNFNLPTGLAPNLVVTGTQFTDATNGYLSGYVPNGSGRRGYLYKTHDGGHTWQIINGTVAATMNGVVMTSAANGYAVGNDGVVLITADGGNSWDIVPLYAKGVTQTLNGVAYDGAGNVAIVGNGTAFSLAGTTYTAGTGISSTDVLISVTYDAVNTAFYAVGDSSGYGVMYKGVLASGAYAWTKLSNNTASLPLYKVQFLGNNVNGSNAASGLTGHGFATGMGGMLLHTTDRGAHWFAVPTYMHQLIRNIFFVNDNVGVALVDSVPHTSQLYQTADGGVTWSLLSKPGQYYYDMSFYYDNSATAVTSHAYKGVAVGYNGIVSRIVTSGTLASPYFGLIPLNSPSSYNLMGVFAELANGKLYMTMGSTGNYMYYTGAGLSNTATQVTWDSVNCSTSVFKTAFVLAGSNYTLLPAAIGKTTHELYTFTSLTTSPWLSINSANDATNPSLTTYNTGSAFYELAEHGTVDGNDSLYAYNNNGSSSGGLYSLYAASSSATELTVKPFGVTTPANITSLGYSGGGNIAGVDSIDGNIYTGVINSTPGVTWTNVSTNIHPLSLYSIQAAGASATTLYASGLRGEFLSGIATGSAINLTELVPVTTKALFSAQAESASPALGIAAGDSSALYQFNYTGGAQNYTPTYTAIPTSSGVAPLYDVAISGTTAYVSGGSGTIYYIPSISANIAQHAISSGKASFIGITTTTHGGAIAVGSNANIWLYGGTAGIQSTAIYCPGFNAENFYSDNNHGYVVGWAGTIRRTDDAGTTWQVVLPEVNSSGVPDYKTVWTTSTSGNAIVAGTGGFVGKAGPGNTVSDAGTSYVYNSSNTTKWYKARFHANYPNNGYMVGSNNGVLTLTLSGDSLPTGGAAPLGTAIPAPGSAGSGTFPVSDLHSLHVFRDNSFMVVGSSGAIYYYNAVASSQWNDESPTAVASYGTYTLMDIDARDDRTMWVAGNSSSIGGSIIKVIDPVNIQPNIPLTYSVTPIGSAWALEPIADGVTANNIVTNANQVTINAIAFSGPYDGFLGGSYSSTPPSSTGGYPYARLLNDRGGVFSTLNWYDRAGHLIVTQNTKQHNYKKPAYTYAIYDVLGRMIETGQKTENTDTITINKIFGDTVLGFYNPNVVSLSKYLTWIKDNTGPRTEATHKYYDVQDILPTNILTQQELRNRIATIAYSDTLRSDSTKYNYATHYSYDVHDDISTVVQDNPSNGISSQRYKRIDYQFDVLSGKINEMDYQNDSLDQYHHKYEYDADDRLVQVQTSKDSIVWDCDVNYFYYPEGRLARTELGDQQIQGIDYSYTIQGWTKGMNSDQLDGTHDMGHDGLQVAGNLNRYFARDAAGLTLKYFDKSSMVSGDYDAISSAVWSNVANRFEAYTYGSDLTNSRHDLFNGNPTAMSTSITQPTNYKTATQPTLLPQGTSYTYDQLYRLIDMKAYQNLNTSTNTWGTTGTYNGLYHNWLTYDANGNITTQKRADSLGNIFDSLTYRYNNNNGAGPTIQNRLYHVNDAVNITGLNYDIKDEGAFNSTALTINQKNNYRYTEVGELAKDSIGGIDTIVWTNYGNIWKIKKYNGDSIIYSYDPLHNRSMKEFKPAIGMPVTTYYIRDVNGVIMATYLEEFNSSTNTTSYSLSEREIYGSSRVGRDVTPVQLIGSPPVSQIDTFARYLGLKEYELENYLGSVLAVVTDRKIPIQSIINIGQVDHYEADVKSATDYYPFGMVEPGRRFNSTTYRFAFGRKEHDDEIYGANNSYDYGARIYDPRLGRYMTTDPLKAKFAGWSPYNNSIDNPIFFVDIDGRDVTVHVGATPVGTTFINLYTGDYIRKHPGVAQVKIEVPVYKVTVSNGSGSTATFYFTRTGYVPTFPDSKEAQQGQHTPMTDVTFDVKSESTLFKGIIRKRDFGTKKKPLLEDVLELRDYNNVNSQVTTGTTSGLGTDKVDHNYSGVQFHLKGASEGCIMAVGTSDFVERDKSETEDVSNEAASSASTMDNFTAKIKAFQAQDKKNKCGTDINVEFDKLPDPINDQADQCNGSSTDAGTGSTSVTPGNVAPTGCEGTDLPNGSSGTGGTGDTGGSGGTGTGDTGGTGDSGTPH